MIWYTALVIHSVLSEDNYNCSHSCPGVTDKSEADNLASDHHSLPHYIQTQAKCVAQGHNNSVHQQEPGFKPPTFPLVFMSFCSLSEQKYNFQQTEKETILKIIKCFLRNSHQYKLPGTIYKWRARLF